MVGYEDTDILLNRTAIPAVTVPIWGSRALFYGLQTLKYVFIGSLMYGMIGDRLENRTQRADMIANTPLYGIWEVETFTLDGEMRPPLLTDTERWKLLLVNIAFPDAEGVTTGNAGVRLMNNQLISYAFNVDSDASSISIGSFGNPEAMSTWTLEQVEDDVIVLNGDLSGKSYSMRLKRKDINEYNLVNRGYHWINEFPNNSDQAVVPAP